MYAPASSPPSAELIRDRLQQRVLGRVHTPQHAVGNGDCCQNRYPHLECLADFESCVNPRRLRCVLLRGDCRQRTWKDDDFATQLQLGFDRSFGGISDALRIIRDAVVPPL